MDEILQESVEVPSDRDNTQAEVDCDHSGVDERPCIITVSYQNTYSLQLYLGEWGYLKPMYSSEANASLILLTAQEAEPLSDAFLGIPNTMLHVVSCRYAM